MVPIMKGRNPKYPESGCHTDEKSSSESGAIERVGRDFWNITPTMIIRNNPEKTAGINNAAFTAILKNLF
jgi:hypothetical protein